MQRRYTELFVTIAAAILLLTGLAKLVSGFGHAKILLMPDPLLIVPFGKLLLAVGAAEVLIAGTCFFSATCQRVKLGLVAWLATVFLVYRLGLWFIGWHHPCGCMGKLAGMLHLSDQAADNIMKVVLAFLLVGSYLLLYLDWRARRAAGPPGSPPPEATGLVPS
jgi:hypothetical protein